MLTCPPHCFLSFNLCLPPFIFFSLTCFLSLPGSPFMSLCMLPCNFLHQHWPLSISLCRSSSLCISCCLSFISRHLPSSISIFLPLSNSFLVSPPLALSLALSPAPPARLTKNLAVIPVAFFFLFLSRSLSLSLHYSFGGLRMNAIQSRPRLRDMNFH